MKKSVVIESGSTEPQIKERLDVDAFLLSHPPGVYTVFRTLHATSVVDFNEHVKRLERSLRGKGQWAKESTTESLEAAFRAASARAMAAGRELLAGAQELRVTALVVDPVALSFSTMAEALPDVAGPVAVEVWRARRETPGVKDSEWVRARKHMKERTHDQPRVNEVVLQSADDGDSLLEGLSSNFFAVTAGGLVTAPEGTVLSGTVRTVVLETCREIGVHVDLRCPKESEASTWDGAFITSTTRLVLEVDEIRFIDEKKGSPRRPPIKFAKGCELTAKLLAAVKQKLESVSVKVL